MNLLNDRRTFFRKTIFGTIAVSAIPLISNAHSLIDQELDQISEIFPSQDRESVQSVVVAAHVNFDKVKDLVTARPALAKSVIDWGFGDWESALGAASHMGRKDIADFLIAHGARPNIYTLAMMGKVDSIRKMVEAIPGIQRIKGPHGITLLDHAQMRLRREDYLENDRLKVENTIAYLESLGDAGIDDINLEISEKEMQIYLGKYVFGTGENDEFSLTINSMGMLFLSRGEYAGRVLKKVAEHTFAPGGAPEVRVKFSVERDRAFSLTIHDPIPLVTARRFVD